MLFSIAQPSATSTATQAAPPSPSAPGTPVGVMAEAPPSGLLARRLSRVVFGSSLLVLPVLLTISFGLVGEPRSTNVGLSGLAAVWLLSLVGAVAGKLAGRLLPVRAVFGDDAFASASIVVPAVGLAVVAPISLQAAVGAPLALLAGADFDGWMAFAIGGTVHVHLAFAVSMGLAAMRLARGHDVRRVALWPAVVLSFIPGALIGFPPLLVWVSGWAISRGFLGLARGWIANDDDAPAM